MKRQPYFSLSVLSVTALELDLLSCASKINQTLKILVYSLRSKTPKTLCSKCEASALFLNKRILNGRFYATGIFGVRDV